MEEIIEMEEIIDIDGRQFKLMTDYPLTMEQKAQAIAEIRRQPECGCSDKMANLGEIYTLPGPVCTTITMRAPANISVSDITIGGVDCGTSACPDIICTNYGCLPHDSLPVVVTFANSGDISGNITPTLTVGTGTPIPANTPTIIVPALGDNTATFTVTAFVRGPNSVCVNWT